MNFIESQAFVEKEYHLTINSKNHRYLFIAVCKRSPKFAFATGDRNTFL
ncbi:MAG: hypothetical protein ACHBN1_28040 [Heteroscytonema crispum UTEX LB 1556]